MNDRIQPASFRSTRLFEFALAGGLLIALLLGLDAVELPDGVPGSNQGPALRLEWFGMEAAVLDRGFYRSLAEDPAAWLEWGLIVLGTAGTLYYLLGRLFRLGALPRTGRFGLYGLIVLLLLVELNPLMARFHLRLPANFPVFARETVRSLRGLLALGAGLALAGFLNELTRGGLARGLDRFARGRGAAMAVLLLAGAACAFVVWARMEPLKEKVLVSDELSYLAQADFFAGGRLADESIRPLAFSNADQMVNDGRFYSKYPPGTSLVLAPFVLVGAPQAAPACFLALNLLLAAWLAKRLFGRGCAILVLGLCAASPFVVSMGESFLSHGPGLTCTLVLALAHHAWLDSRKPGFALLAGGAGGLLLLIRPVTAAAVLLPFAIHGLVAFRGTSRKRIAGYLCYLAGGAAGVLATLAYNQAQTGEALLFPYARFAELYASFDRYGFHNASQGLLNSAFNLARLDHWLFGITLSLLPAAALFVFRKAGGYGLLFLGVLLALTGAYALHWFWGTPWHGPLYFYEASVFLMLLTARGIQVSSERLKGWRGPVTGMFLLVGITVLVSGVPRLLEDQVDRGEERVGRIFGPVIDASDAIDAAMATGSEFDEQSENHATWLIMERNGEGFDPTYVGSAPPWLTGGFRILDGHAEDPTRLATANPDARIFHHVQDTIRRVK